MVKARFITNRRGWSRGCPLVLYIFIHYYIHKTSNISLKYFKLSSSIAFWEQSADISKQELNNYTLTN